MTTNNKKPISPLVIERTFNAPVSKVWKALTSTEDIKHWSFPLKEFKPQVGFEFRFDAKKDDFIYRHHCRITEAIVDKKLAYTWRYEGYEGDSLVVIELFKEGHQTRIRLTHTGLDTFPNIPDFDRRNFEMGWTMIIGENLKQFVEKT